MSNDRSLRFACAGTAFALAVLAYFLQGHVAPRAQALCGIVCFILIIASCSSNLRAVNVRTVAWGIGLQLLLAVFILKFEIFGIRPGYEFFNGVAAVVKRFLAFTREGATFVFGDLAKQEVLGKVLPNGFVFAFTALPTIIFISSFFTVLYYYGILQRVVALMARAMMYLMRTSGAETLSVAANVFMGQTEAPLIVKPYVPRMTQSELLTLMVGGMAHISGGVMAVYIGLGADAVAILCTSVMAAPASLYVGKLLLPEAGVPETLGDVKPSGEKEHANVIDAAAAGASQGMQLAINIAAMLIAFIAFIALFNFLIKLV